MFKLKQKVFNKSILIAPVIITILTVLILTSSSTALASLSSNTNLNVPVIIGVNYQFGYEGEGDVSPGGTTDISGAATTSGLFIRDVTASSQDNQCSIDIPTGTIGLTEDLEPLTEISIAPAETPPEPPTDNSIIGIPYDFGPDGATFDPPVPVSLTYDPEQIPTGIDINDLKIAMYVTNPATGEKEWTVLSNIRIDPVTHTITGDTSHFTVFAIIVSYTPPVPAPAEPLQTNWGIVIGVAIAGVVVIIVLVFLLRRD